MNTRISSMILAMLALVVTSAVGAVAQQEQSGQGKQPQSGSMDMSKMNKAPAKGQQMTEAKMMERCQEMKEQKQKMEADIKAQDAQLTEQLTEMNRAPKEKKMP